MFILQFQALPMCRQAARKAGAWGKVKVEGGMPKLQKEVYQRGQSNDYEASLK